MNNQLPAEELLIKAAADLSGHDPGELDAREALHILQEYGREPMGDLYRQLTDAAAAEHFDDPTHSAEWEELAGEFEGDYPDLVALTLQRDLSPAIKEKARAMYDDLPQDDPQRDELEKIINEPVLSPETREVMESMNRITNNIAAKIMQPFAVDIKGIQDAIAPILETTRGISEIIAATQEAIRAAMAPMDFSKLYTQYGAMLDGLTELMESNPKFALFDEMQGDLAPYIEEELKKPQYSGKTIEELIDEAEETDDGLFTEDSLLMQAVNAARAAAGEFIAAVEEEPATGGEIQKAPIHQSIAEMDFSTDHLPYIFFGGSLPTPAKQDVPGQLSFTPIKEKYSSDGHPESFVYWHYFFDEATFEKFGLSKVYDYEDYFILCVLFTERVLGNTVISPTALYRDVYGKEPGDDDLERFRKRLQKLDATRIYINNHDLMQTWKGVDPDATYTEGLYHLINIDFTIERYLFNGKVAKETIHIGEVPALLQIGADLNRMTKIPKSAFYISEYKGDKATHRVRSTPRYWHALIYLTRRVAQMKNGSGQTKILYDTLYNELHAKKPREKQLTRDVVFKILEHWKRIGWIKSYKEEPGRTPDKAGIRIALPGNTITTKKRKQIAKKKATKAEKKE